MKSTTSERTFVIQLLFAFALFFSTGVLFGRYTASKGKGEVVGKVIALSIVSCLIAQVTVTVIGANFKRKG